MIWACLIASVVIQVVLFVYAFVGPRLERRRNARLNARPARIDFDEARSKARRGEGLFLHNPRYDLDGVLWFLPGPQPSDRAARRALYRGRAVQVESATHADVEALLRDPALKPRVVLLVEPEAYPE